MHVDKVAFTTKIVLQTKPVFILGYLCSQGSPAE